MSDSTRRGFVKGSVAAAAGISAIGALAGETAEADAKTVAATQNGGMVAHVKDARSGEVSLMWGDRTVTLRDRQLAARILRAAG